MYTALTRMVQAQEGHVHRRKVRLLRDAGRAEAAATADPAAPAGGPGRPPLARRGQTALQGTATPRRSRTTTTCPTRFYEWVLGPSMAYTCACYPRPRTPHWRRPRRTSTTWWPGSWACSPGCGCSTSAAAGAAWCGTPPGSTGSRRSASRCPRSRRPGPSRPSRTQGLAGLAEVRHLDYRDVPESGFDAVSSIGLTEHIGKAKLPGYFAFLYGKLQPEGRLLNHCITRPDNTGPAPGAAGSSTGTCSPTGSWKGPGYLLSLMNDTGFEVRHEENLREHYARTLAGLVRQPGRALGRGGGRGGRGHRPGVAALHGGLAARFRAQRRPAAPDPGRQAGRGRPGSHAAAPRLGERGRHSAPAWPSSRRGGLAPGGWPRAGMRGGGLPGAVAGESGGRGHVHADQDHNGGMDARSLARPTASGTSSSSARPVRWAPRRRT